MPKQMNESDFNKIKSLSNAGLRPGEIAQFVARGTATIGRISRVNTFEEYRDMLHEQGLKYRKPKPVVKHEVSVPPSPEAKFVRIPSLASNEEIYLGRIADAVERLADAWESKPKGGTLFGKRI